MVSFKDQSAFDLFLTFAHQASLPTLEAQELINIHAINATKIIFIFMFPLFVKYKICEIKVRSDKNRTYTYSSMTQQKTQRRCLTASNNTTPVATDTFKLLTVPAIGILIK